MKGKTLLNILFALISAAIVVYFFPHQEENHYKFEEGRPWNYPKLIAPFDIPIRPDSATVMAVRDSLDEAFIPVFGRDKQVVKNVTDNLMAQWAQADVESAPSVLEDVLRRKLVPLIRAAYDQDIIEERFGERIAQGKLPAIKLQIDNTVSRYSTSGIAYPTLIMAQLASKLGIDTVAAIQWLKKNNVADLLEPNIVYNEETSERLYQNEIERVAAVKGVIMQGQTIIDKGAIITPQDYTNLMTYEQMVDAQISANTRSQWMVMLGEFLYVALLYAALFGFLRFSAPDLWGNRRSMLFIMLLLTVFFLLAVLLNTTIDNGVYLTPFAIVPVLLIVFFNAHVALFVSIVEILLCAGIVSFPLEFILLQFLASVAAVYSMRELTRRSQLLQTAIFVLLAYVIGYFTIEVMLNGAVDDVRWRMIAYLAVSAAASSMAYILMVVVEKMFGFVSVVTLIELADTNNPILRELSQECPGTFQHSMAVGNLATDAAIKIGANEQLVRAGAMYHDIGKMSNPNFFTENQRGVNPHDALSPEQSARIIVGHITDGVTRADKAGLPAPIKDLIVQHHGRGTAKYFYYNFCKAHPDEQVDPTPFSYPGPNPQTREASVLMMADSVEAASRSLKEHSQEAIRALVNKIIDGQIADGLHNESPLEFKDVQTIKDAFVRRLMTMYHSRIVYPDAPKTTKQ